MAEQSLGLESVPFFKKPLDASESDRIVGQDDAGNFVYQTFLGNRYTVARDPDQRTTRTKIEEDVIPAVKAYAENPRLPTGEEVVGAGKAIVEGAVETASIPGDLLTGKRSPTDVQMGDAFDIAGGASVGAGLQTLPDNAVGSMVGAFRRKEKPYVEKSIGINLNLDKTLSLKDAFGEEGVENFYAIKNPARSGRFAFANKIFDGVNIGDFLENVYSKLDTKKLSEPRVYSKFLSSSGEDIIKEYSDKLVFDSLENIIAKGSYYPDNFSEVLPDNISDALSDNFIKLVDNLRNQQFNLDERAKFKNLRPYDISPVKDNIFVPTETELAFPSPRLEQKTDTSFSYPTQTINLSGPISSYVETMNIPKKGITANNFLKEIRNNLNVPVRVFPDSFVDSSKRYTREELLDLVEQKEFKVKAQEQEMYQGTQRQNEAGFTYGDEQEYFFMNIAATTGAGKITPRRQHSSRDDIGHVRGSIITPNVNSPYSNSGAITEFNNVTENKPFLLAEEFQSDLYQKGYKKTNPKFMQEAVKRYYGGVSKKVQKVIEDSSLAANKINLPAVNDYGYIRNNTMIITDEAIERTMKDATERGYIGGDTFDSISFSVDRLKGVETDEVFKPAYLDPLRIENTVRMLAEKGVSINLPETEVFRGEMFVPPSIDVETIFKVDPLSLSNSSFIADQSTFLDSNPQVLSRVQSMNPDTAEIFNTTTIGELNAATQEWLESLGRSAQSQGIEKTMKAAIGETNAERMGRGDFISADDIGGRTSGDIGDPGTISEVAENLVRKKLGLSLNDESGYPDDINSYFKLVNAYSDLIYQQISFPNDTVNVLGKLSATKKTDDKQIKKLEDYITKTTQGILDYRTKIVDQENEMDKHFEKFVDKLDGTEVTSEQAKGLLRAAYTDLKRNTNDFQGLDAVTPPINKVKSVTDEMLKILIVKAATSGVDKIVIPPTDRIAAIRFRDHRASPEKFTQLYDEGIPASIQELKQNYPEVIVTRDVKMPYDNSMYPPGYNDIPSNQGTVIDLEAFFKKYDVSPDGSVRQFAQGGVAMKDQMEMSFAIGGVAETVDPVSGNDVPPGSLPEEVRDDIPARLSEGEYVVPADVVRYYGVKFFEDLRTQAKMGLQQMDADGRIGGEPMEPQQAELSDDDLNSIIEQAMQQEQPMMANEGGVVGYYSGGGNFDYLGGSIFGPQKKATDTTAANQFYDPDVGGYKPTTGPYGPDPQAAPVVAAARVADPVCPTGFRYDRNQGRCVPKSEGPDVVNQTVNTGGIKFGKDFGKSVDWNDATAVQEFALGTPGDSTKSGLNTPFKPFGLDKKSQNQLAGAALLVGGVNPVSLLAGAATRIYQNVDATKDLAGLRASEIIAYAKGHNEVGGKINKAIGQYVEQAGKGYSNKSGLLKNIVGTGYNYASEVLGVKKEDLKNFMSIVDNTNSTETEVAEAQRALQKKMTQTAELVVQSSKQEDKRKQEKITAAQQAVLTAQKTPIQSGRLEKMLGVPSQGRPARDSEGNDLSGLDPTDLNWEEVRQLRSHDSAANRQKLAEWEAASGKDGSSGAQAGSGGCFLTTAIVEHRGEADDGPTLTKLRNFRDTYLVDYPEEVKKYYQVAPKIVAAIPKDNPTWDWVGKQIDSAIEHIDNNMLDKAHETYKSMVLELETNWLKKA